MKRGRAGRICLDLENERGALKAGMAAEIKIQSFLSGAGLVIFRSRVV